MEYYLLDYETGYPYQVTKEQYEAFQRIWEAAKPKLSSSKGTIVVFGTGGEMEAGDTSGFYEPSWSYRSMEGPRASNASI